MQDFPHRYTAAALAQSRGRGPPREPAASHALFGRSRRVRRPGRSLVAGDAAGRRHGRLLHARVPRDREGLEARVGVAALRGGGNARARRAGDAVHGFRGPGVAPGAGGHRRRARAQPAREGGEDLSYRELAQGERRISRRRSRSRASGRRSGHPRVSYRPFDSTRTGRRPRRWRGRTSVAASSRRDRRAGRTAIAVIRLAERHAQAERGAQQPSLVADLLFRGRLLVGRAVPVRSRGGGRDHQGSGQQRRCCRFQDSHFGVSLGVEASPCGRSRQLPEDLSNTARERQEACRQSEPSREPAGDGATPAPILGIRRAAARSSRSRAERASRGDLS